MGTIEKENKTLWVDSAKLLEDTELSHNGHDKFWLMGRMDANDGDKKKMQHELHKLMEKYEEMARR